MRILFLLGFGFLPLWFAASAVYTENAARGAHSDYMSAAPWLLIYGLMLSGVTCLMAMFTLWRFNRAEGGLGKKLLAGGLAFLLCIGVSAAAIAWWLHTPWDPRTDGASERQQAQEVVARSPLVSAATGPSRRSTSFTGFRGAAGKPPHYYELALVGDRGRTIVIVDVDRPLFSRKPRLTVACVDPPRRSPVHPCR